MLALRRVYLSSVLFQNASNPISKPRFLKSQPQKVGSPLNFPRDHKFYKKLEATTVKKRVEKKIVIPTITAMKDYVEPETAPAPKPVQPKPKKVQVDKVREFYLSLGRLRKFEPLPELDRSYIRTGVPDPAGLHVDPQYAPKLYMRNHELGGFTKSLVLNDYDTFNTMDVPYFSRLDELLKKWEHDQVITSIVWESSSLNFSAGIDYQSTFGTPAAVEFLEKRFKNAYRIYTMRKPFAPIMSGLVLGNASSLGLLANCSMATETSMLNIPEPSFGYIPDAGLPFALSRTGYRGLGEFLAASGYTLRGQDIFLSRLSRYYIPDERIPSATHELASLSSSKVGRLLNALNSVHEPVHRNKFSLREKLPIIGPCFDKDTIQEVFQALEASHNGFAVDILNKMNTFSPLCLAVTHRLVREALDTNIETSLRKNFIVSQNIMRSADYIEGIKARIENRTPSWKHKSVFEVTKEEVDAMFAKNEHTKDLELEASSYVPLNGPIFKYVQNKSRPEPFIGGSFIAELDQHRYDFNEKEGEVDPLGLLLYKRSQIEADRIFYKTNPEAVEPWLPGGEKASIIEENRGRLYDVAEDSEILGQEEEVEEEEVEVEEEEEGLEDVSEEQVENFLKTSSSTSEPTGLLPDYDFLKTQDPPSESIFENEEEEEMEVEEEIDTSSPYYEVIEDEEFPQQDDTVRDDDLIVRSDSSQSKKAKQNLWDQYYPGAKPIIQRDDKMWLSKLSEEDKY